MDDEKFKTIMGYVLASAFCLVVLVIAGALTYKFLQWLF